MAAPGAKRAFAAFDDPTNHTDMLLEKISRAIETLDEEGPEGG